MTPLDAVLVRVVGKSQLNNGRLIENRIWSIELCRFQLL